MMSSMDIEIDGKSPRLNSYRLAIFLIGLTAAACLSAVIFRVPIRSRYWAWQVIDASGVEQRALPLTCLCNAGDAGRWGTNTLIDHESAEIRQYGVLALQYTRSDWARESLVRLLSDPDDAVRELAALGLAVQGDRRVIPELRRLFLEGQVRSAVAAVLALQRLATPEAVAVLAELVHEPADVARRAALVDALTRIGGVDCAAALLVLLDDHRPCDIPSREEQFLNDLTPFAFQQGFVDINNLSQSVTGTGKLAYGEPAHGTRAESATATSSELTPTPSSHTIAERAANGLARITGLIPPFSSNQPADQQTVAVRAWKEWIETRMEMP